MTQEVSERFWQAEARTKETKRFIRDINRITRRKFTAEEKMRIVLEGFRRDTLIRDLCRRESIGPSTYYAWLKDFMGAGKERLQRDTVRDATRAEVEGVKRENARLKQLVAELSLEVHVLALVAGSGLPRRRALAQPGLPKSTYYRWLKRQSEKTLQYRRGG